MMSTKPGKKEDHGKSLMEASSRQTVLVKSAPIPIPLPPLQLDPLTFSDCCEFPKAYPQCCRCKTCSYISKTMMETSSTERGTVRMKSANIPILSYRVTSRWFRYYLEDTVNTLCFVCFVMF